MPRLELHLERIKASAAELGFAFDRHEARNRIQALCFELEAPAKLRLLLARSGEISLESRAAAAAAGRRRRRASRCRCRSCPATGGCATRPPTAASTRTALAVAQARGAREALFVRDDGLVTEGSFTNLFVERGGKLLTPPAALGLLPGVLRRALLDEGRAEEAELTLADLADGFFIGNALRGLIACEVDRMSHEHLSQALRRIAASRHHGDDRPRDRAARGRAATSSRCRSASPTSPPRRTCSARRKVALDTGHTKYTPVTGTLRAQAGGGAAFPPRPRHRVPARAGDRHRRRQAGDLRGARRPRSATATK